MIKKNYLLSPGPTPIPDSVLSIASRAIIHHRTPEFSNIFMEVTEGLKYVFQTKEDVFILASSGTGAMEMAVVNIVSPEDKVITINGGKFGGRWGELCRAYGAEVEEIDIGWGNNFSKEQLMWMLDKHPDAKAVFATLSETSTGTVYDIRGYGEAVSKTKALLVVDGISGLGAVPCPMDDWHIDVMISASQKSFMTPPGLAFIAFSRKAWKVMEKCRTAKYYFDAGKYKEALTRKTSPFTPAISLVIQQMEALRLLREWGLEKLFENHRILGEATRAGVKAIGLELFSQNPGNILTAVKVPPDIDGEKLVKLMQQKYGAYIAGGQGSFKGKIFRISHLGYMGGFDIITALTALEMSLSELGFNFQIGEAVKAAEKIIKENWHNEKNTYSRRFKPGSIRKN